MAKEKKGQYVVAPGFSFVGKKRAYVSGDEIDENAFGDPKNFQKFLSGKNPRIVVKPPETAAPAVTGNTSAGSIERKALEETALKLGYTPEDIKKLTDDDLKLILEDEK
jgi:hypothetical protein